MGGRGCCAGCLSTSLLELLLVLLARLLVVLVVLSVSTSTSFSDVRTDERPESEPASWRLRACFEPCRDGSRGPERSVILLLGGGRRDKFSSPILWIWNSQGGTNKGRGGRMGMEPEVPLLCASPSKLLGFLRRSVQASGGFSFDSDSSSGGE